jgi:hypothetical protein
MRELTFEEMDEVAGGESISITLVLTLAGAVLGVVGLAFAIWSYFNPSTTRTQTYQVNPGTTVHLPDGTTLENTGCDLTVTYADGSSYTTHSSDPNACRPGCP